MLISNSAWYIIGIQLIFYSHYTININNLFRRLFLKQKEPYFVKFLPGTQEVPVGPKQFPHFFTGKVGAVNPQTLK